MKSIPLHRAWRFIHPDPRRDQGPAITVNTDTASKGICLNHAGDIATIEKDASIRQAILLLLATRPSERVMRPDYGCDLHKLVFAPNDDTTAGLAIHYVKKAIDRWEPRIEILHIDATRNEEIPERLEIRLDYQVKNRSTPDHLMFSFSLIG